MNIRRWSSVTAAVLSGIAIAWGGATASAGEGALRSLGEFEVALYGVRATVDPPRPIVPKRTASGLRILVEAGGRTLSSPEVARLLGGPFQVQAELSGPGLAGVLSLPLTGAEAVPSPDPLVLTFPGLPRAGDYDIANVRLVRDGRPVLDVQPRRVTLRVIDQVLVTSVVTRPLTLEEIRERGVVLDASSYLGFEFAITVRLESTPVKLQLPVVFTREGVPIPLPLQPPPEPLRSVVSAPQFVPVLLRPRAPETDPDGAPPGTNEVGGLEEAGAQVPSLLVIPGSVGYLKQFFSAQLLVGNGAPEGSGLVVRDVVGALKLPPGPDGRSGNSDDPLTLAPLESGQQSPIVEVLGEDGTSVLLPGAFGRAELTLRGEHEGRHDVDFDIEATLEGLPLDPVTLEGHARGAVLVRNAYFDVTFTVPTVVRADEEFSVFATVSNIGQGTGQDVKLTMDAARLSGALLLSSATQVIDSLGPGDSRTLTYRFRSEVTGEVVASYLRFDTNGGTDVTGRLNFTLGVGERGVALSPDTLVLPTTVAALPSDVVQAAMRVLGQAWSAATATTLPPGVERPSTAAVFQKGLALAEAGLRVELGQPLPDALRDLLLDLHGGLFDPGFDQVLRETRAGADFDRVAGLALQDAVGGDALRYEEDAAEIAASGSAFLSFALDGQSGVALPAGVALLDGAGRRTGADSRGVPTGVIVSLGADSGAPRLGWVSSLAEPPYVLQVNGTADGAVNLSLTVPGADGEARRARVTAIEVHAGSRARLVYDPAQGGDLALEEDAQGDGIYEQRSPVTTASLASRGPQLTSAATIGPETLAGASPFGTYAALLFDRVVSEEDAADLASYEIARNSVVAAKRQLSGRLVFVAFEQPEGPLVATRLVVEGIRDERGRGGTRQALPLASRLILPGAVVMGRVLQADGTPVPDARVTYVNALRTEGGSTVVMAGVAAQQTDGAGQFELRYVSQDPGGAPFRLETLDPDTGAVRGIKGYVRFHGQRMGLDLVLVGHGNVTGTVRHPDGTPADGARVRVVSVTDSQIGIVATTDGSGHYSVQGMTVGAVAVTAVLGANLGRGAGRLDAAGGTTTVDVTLDGNVDVTGQVRRLEDGVLAPVVGVDVVYHREGTPLGVSVTDSDGRYRLLGVPAGAYRLEAGLNTRDKARVTGNSMAGQKLVQDLVITVLDYSSYGTVRGTVRRLGGSPVADAWVSDNVVATSADSLGRYELTGVALSLALFPHRIEAVSPDGRRSGSTSVVLTTPGQVVEGADIELSGLGTAVFQVLDANGAAVVGASVGLQGSCLHPCGCRFASTDDKGLARFTDLPFGMVSARAAFQGPGALWDTAVGSATVTSEEVAAGGLIRTSGFGTVTGVVKNPDGQPAHGASVVLTALRFVNGAGVCGLVKTPLPPAYTDQQGQFRFEGVHVGAVSVQAFSTTFPTTVAASGEIVSAGQNASLELRLVDTMAGELSGTVLLPDGSGAAGPHVEVTASGPIPDVTVRTDVEGRYSFARVLPKGSYLLTARDSRPDGTGSLAQTRIYLQASSPAQHDLRLKAKGPVRVTVVDGNGTPVEGATVSVEVVETSFPYRRYQGTIGGPGEQPLVFPGVFEGAFSVKASDNFARGGRANGSVPPGGQAVDVKVKLTTTGSVTGRFLWADRKTPLPIGTVRLVAGGRDIGQQTTASEGDIGSFSFDYVPAGQVRLEAEDPKSGRTGVAVGSLASEGEVLKLDVVVQAVGRVEGGVTLNGEPAPGAEVSLRSGAYRVRVTADGEGGYAVEGVPEGQVSVTADLGRGFLAGSATGTLSGEEDTLTLPVALRGAGTIEGRLLAAGPEVPSAPGAISLITLNASGRTQTTTTDDQGHFRFELVPEGSVELVADALASIDCARMSLSVEGGETVPADLLLRGVGTLEGTTASSSGPVGGQLTISGTGPGCVAHQWVLAVGPAGQFRVLELLAGDVSASFRTGAPGGPKLYASAAGVVTPGQTTTLNLHVEPSGRVQGTVVHADGVPAIGSKVRVDGSGSRYTVVQTGDQGAFLAEGIPVGAVTLRVTDDARGGVALVSGLTVPENGTVNAGEIHLIETPLAVTSVGPADGAVDVPVTELVQIAFNAPLSSGGGFGVHSAGRPVGFTPSLSADRFTVTLAPSGGAWPDSREVALEAGLWVTDVYGRRLPAPFRSRFRTVDLSPPRVVSVVPAHGAIQVDPATTVTVTFGEPIATNGDLQPLVLLSSAAGSIAGTVTSPAPDTLLFTPAAALTSNLVHAVTVNGATDLLGHVQTAAFTSSFTTPDTGAPVLQLDAPEDGGWTKQRRPTVRVAVKDTLTGPDTSHAEMRVDGQVVAISRSTGQIAHYPQADFAEGAHTVDATAHDRAGNLGTVAASFQIDSQPPTAAMLTSPSTDQVVAGVVPLAGTATDPGSGVARLNFLRDGVWIGEAGAASGFATTWNTAGAAEGDHQATAYAVDVAGNNGPPSASVHVIVNNRPLGISITAPAEGSRAFTEVTAAAAPSEPVARVEFRAGSGATVADDTAPYEVTLDLTSEPEGSVILTVTAVGLPPETATAIRTVLVDRTPPDPPDPTRVHAEAMGESALVVGLSGAVELGSHVEVTNPSRQAMNQRAAFPDGSFALRLAGVAGETLAVVAVDEAGNRSDPLALAITQGASHETAVPLEGLGLWARAGDGVTADADGRVAHWADQSSQGNHLVQPVTLRQPLVDRDPTSGMDVLRFDGTNDFMAFTTGFEGTIRAVFVVLRDSTGGSAGERWILSDPVTSDFRAGYPAYLWGSQASPLVLNGQTWLNGVAVDGMATSRPTAMSVLSVVPTAGVSASRLFTNNIVNSFWMGDIAELVIYTQPLSDFDRKSVEDYLALKYAVPMETAAAPEFTPEGGTFVDSLTVSLASPTPGAEVRYTADGSEPTESSPLYAGPFVLTATTTVRARAFHPQMSPSPVSIAFFSEVGNLSPASIPGLVLWTRADAGVAVDEAGRVSLWQDGSGRANDLGQATADARPTLVPDASGGLPVVRFDGTDDVLLFTSRLPNIRTVFWVVREEPAAPNGYRFLLGDASTYHFLSGTAHQILSSSVSAAVKDGKTRLNGVLVDGTTTNRPTSLSVISLVTTGDVAADSFSRDRTYGRRWWGDLAELVVYDRALSDSERKAVEDHLALKYALYAPALAAPAFSPNGSTVAAPVRVTLSAEAGADVRYTTDGIDPTEASALYVEPFVLTARTTVKARAFRAGFNPSPAATATFLDGETPAPLRAAGLKLWVKADAGVTAPGGFVSSWADQSGNGNHLVQATPANQPQLVAGAANGLPAVRLDGAGDFLAFTTRLTTIRTVFWMVRADPSSLTAYRHLLGDASTYSFSSGATSTIWHASSTNTSIRTGETRLGGTIVDGVTTNRPTSLSLISVVTTGEVIADALSRDRTYDRSWWGDLAELIIYDRPLPDGERQAIEGYLATKYALYVPTVVAPTIDPPGGRVAGTQLVQLDSATPGATLHYALDDTEPTEASPTYAGPIEINGTTRVRARAFLPGWNPSPESVVTFYGEEAFTPAAVAGLAVWVRSDAGLGADEVAAWRDQGAASNDLLQTAWQQRPRIVVDTASRMPVVRFDGAGDTLSFTTRLTGIRTVFWVVRRSPAMTPGYRFLLGDASANHFSSDSTTRIWSATYTRSAIRRGETRLNGAPVDGVTTDRPADLSVVSVVALGDVSASTFSKDRGNDYSWWGDLAELVVYERGLSWREVRAVEEYLAGRYGVGLAP